MTDGVPLLRATCVDVCEGRHYVTVQTEDGTWVRGVFGTRDDAEDFAADGDKVNAWLQEQADAGKGPVDMAGDVEAFAEVLWECALRERGEAGFLARYIVQKYSLGVLAKGEKAREVMEDTWETVERAEKGAGLIASKSERSLVLRLCELFPTAIIAGMAHEQEKRNPAPKPARVH